MRVISVNLKMAISESNVKAAPIKFSLERILSDDKNTMIDKCATSAKRLDFELQSQNLNTKISPKFSIDNLHNFGASNAFPSLIDSAIPENNLNLKLPEFSPKAESLLNDRLVNSNFANFAPANIQSYHNFLNMSLIRSQILNSQKPSLQTLPNFSFRTNPQIQLDYTTSSSPLNYNYQMRMLQNLMIQRSFQQHLMGQNFAKFSADSFDLTGKGLQKHVDLNFSSPLFNLNCSEKILSPKKASNFNPLIGGAKRTFDHVGGGHQGARHHGGFSSGLSAASLNAKKRCTSGKGKGAMFSPVNSQLLELLGKLKFTIVLRRKLSKENPKTAQKNC